MEEIVSTVEPVKRPRASPAPRLTVQGTAYYQRPGSDGPTGYVLSFSRSLGATEEDVYAHESRLSEEWIPVDLGWLAGTPVAFLVLRACPKFGAVEVGVVTEAEGVVAVVPFAFIPPGESLPFTPVDAGGLRVRTALGQSQSRVTASVVPG